MVRVEQNVRFQHGRAGIAVVSDGQRVRSKTLPEDRARKNHGVDAVPGSNRRSRVHHFAELNAAQHLIPHVDSGNCGHVPGSISIRKRAARVAQLELHHWAPAARPLRAFERVTVSSFSEDRRGADHQNGRELRQ